MAYNIAKLIPNTEIDETLINRYNSCVQTLLNDYPTTTVTITPASANMYVGDLYGLFKNVIELPYDAIYPNILANGYKSSSEYDGSKLTFIILNNDAVINFVMLFKK